MSPWRVLKYSLVSEISCVFTFPHFIRPFFPLPPPSPSCLFWIPFPAVSPQVQGFGQERSFNCLWKFIGTRRLGPSELATRPIYPGNLKTSLSPLLFSKFAGHPFQGVFAGDPAFLLFSGPSDGLLPPSVQARTPCTSCSYWRLALTHLHWGLWGHRSLHLVEVVSTRYPFRCSSYFVFRENCGDSKNYVLLSSSQNSNILWRYV